ncbi:hypothetical protein YDYSY3_51450 [Paenibacillus chitinolyticus]|nr:hypothetical protein YDYSY3_51450 [Paenibacillus chitinolyticus]
MKNRPRKIDNSSELSKTKHFTGIVYLFASDFSVNELYLTVSYIFKKITIPLYWKVESENHIEVTS